jgi:acetate---CoA ligase (ADP-forming)
MSDLDSIAAFFKPQRVAVLGASSDPKKFGGRVLLSLKKSGFDGQIYPVNRSEPEVHGLKAYPTLSDLPAEPELVLVSIPAATVPNGISEAVAVNAKAAVVYAAGFAEAGGDGRKLQDDLVARLAKRKLRVIGPNCLGVRDFHRPMNASTNAVASPEPGPIAFLSQSGSFGNAAYESLRSLRAGLSIYASIGNMVDVAHADLIRYCGEDPNTTVIAAFAEGVPDIDALLDAIGDVAPRKPVVILKAGRSPFGQRAALSHTSSMAADGRVMSALLREAGAVVVESMQELFDTAAAFAKIGRDLPRSRRTSIFAVSGGPSVVASDHCHDEGLELPPLAERLASLRPIVPTFAALGNPVEVTGQTKGEAFITCARTLAEQDVVDSVIAISIGLDIAEFGQGMVAARQLKPVIGCATGANLPVLFAEHGIPNYPSPERAVRVLRHLADRGVSPPGLRRESAEPLAARPLPSGVHGEAASKKYLAAYGLPVTKEAEARTLDATVAAAEAIGYPVALKVSSSEVAHKSDRGGVLLGITDAPGLRSAWRTLQDRFPGEAVLVQHMAKPGLELIVGAKRTTSTGAVVVIGMGGVFTEALDDVAICRAPATRDSVLEAMDRLRARKLLDGYRGQPAVDRAAVADIAVALSRVMAANPSIAEVDLNPVMAWPRGAVIVDALMRVE